MKKISEANNPAAIWIIVIGVLLSIVVPLLLPFWHLNYLKDFGSIGDAIGGIANPITQLVGFLLLYLALKAQIRANTLIQGQIENEDRKEMRQRELNNLHQLYIFLENNIKNFNYEDRYGNNKQGQILYGRRAIRCFIDDIEKMNIDLHNAEQLLKEDGVREILSVLKLSKLVLDKIENTEVNQDDKILYSTIMKHELIFSIFPYTDLDESANLKLAVCEHCGEPHGNYPPLIFDKLKELKRYF